MGIRALKFLPFLLLLLIVAVGCSSSNEGKAFEGYNFPDYVMQGTHAQTKDAYAYAVDHGDLLDYIPCYCNCYEEPFRHESVKDCFINNQYSTDQQLVYDPHGAA